MNQVMQNRSNYGLDSTAFQGYLDKLNISNQPFQQQQQNITQARDAYQNSQAQADAQKWNNATIQDIAAKYGFDYSRDYAKQQAEAEAQALRNANMDAQRRNVSNRDTSLASIDANLMNQAEAMDRNYFQQMMGQQQNQVNAGLNAGIAADQDLRLQMARQAEMGASYRDANLGRMRVNENFNLDDIRLAEAMGLIDQQALAREDSLYNDRLMQGFGQLMNEREMANSLDQQMWGRSQAEIDRALNQQNVLRQAGQWQTAFDYGAERDRIGDQQWQQQFDWGKLIDTANQTGMFNGERNLAGQQFDWGKVMDEAGLMGVLNGQRTLPGQQFDWSKVVDQHGMNLADKQFALQQQQAAAANAARLSRGGGGGGGSRSSGGRSGSSAPSPSAQSVNDLYRQYKTEQNMTKVSSQLGTMFNPVMNAALRTLYGN